MVNVSPLSDPGIVPDPYPVYVLQLRFHDECTYAACS
jgi:hypothetical protein